MASSVVIASPEGAWQSRDLSEIASSPRQGEAPRNDKKLVS